MLLSLLLLLPVLGSLLLLLIPAGSRWLLRVIALSCSVLTFLVSLFLWTGFDSGSADMQFVEQASWIEAGGLNFSYHVGIDGLSLFLVILTTLLVPIVVLSSWPLTKLVKPYMICLLALEFGMIGAFVALDLLLFYVFWEVMLIPMYFLIGVWGAGRRVYAAVKFFIYTMAGSMMMLVAIITLYFYNQGTSLSIVGITQKLASSEIILPAATERLLFLAFFLAFAIKIPLFPFHTWLPDAHTEAPTAGSVILAGVLLKMGTYGLLRFCLPMFPNASVFFASPISALAIIGILYGALVAMVQVDVKRLVAYSSVSHLGLVVLGIFAFNLEGIEGATLQMLNHGISTGALFLLVGMIYERRHSRMIADFGGLAHSMPVFAGFFLLITLSSIGLPGLNGFVGEFLILQGTFLESPVRSGFAALTMILAAVYMLWMYQRVFLGDLQHEENRELSDLGKREVLLLVPLVFLVFWIGLGSSTFLRPMDATLESIVERVKEARDAQVIRVELRGR